MYEERSVLVAVIAFIHVGNSLTHYMNVLVSPKRHLIYIPGLRSSSKLTLKLDGEYIYKYVWELEMGPCLDS